MSDLITRMRVTSQTIVQRRLALLQIMWTEVALLFYTSAYFFGVLTESVFIQHHISYLALLFGGFSALLASQQKSSSYLKSVATYGIFFLMGLLLVISSPYILLGNQGIMYALAPLGFALVAYVVAFTQIIVINLWGSVPSKVLVGFSSGLKIVIAVIAYSVIAYTAQYAPTWHAVSFVLLLILMLGVDWVAWLLSSSRLTKPIRQCIFYVTLYLIIAIFLVFLGLFIYWYFLYAVTR